MTLRKIRIAAFRSHMTTEVDLPSHGIVLVTGANGAGKSAVLESVVWTLWGDTLRGGDPRRPAVGAGVLVDLGDLEVQRFSEGKQKVHWFLREGNVLVEQAPSSTNTETQALVEKRIGSLESFLHSCVFTREMLGAFTTANDRTRKELLERLTGMEHLADAEERARMDLAVVVSETAKASAAELSAIATYSAACEHLHAVEQLDESSKLPDLAHKADVAVSAHAVAIGSWAQAKIDDAVVESAVTAAVAEVEKRRELAKPMAQDLAAKDALLHSAHGVVLRLRSLSGTCPVCLQAVEKDGLLKCLTAAEEARALAQADRDAVYQSFKEAEQGFRDAQLAMRGKQEAHKVTGLAKARAKDHVSEVSTRAQVALSTLQATEERVKQHAAVLAEAQVKYKVALAATVDVAADAAYAKNLALVQEHVVKALGPQGARARLLANRLHALGEAATQALGEMGLPWSIELLPTTEKKSGKVVDAISLRVQGGQPYEDASTGERRRIDVAILLALARLSEGWNPGGIRGPLWFDEVVDVLDAAGIEAFAQVITKISASRCVVLITHREDLKGCLSPALSLRVEKVDGVSSVVVS